MTSRSSRRKSRTGRRSYSDELKAEAVEILPDGHNAESVVSNLGLSGASPDDIFARKRVTVPIKEVPNGPVLAEQSLALI